ncbi:TrlF family AAA-like ATPase [Tardiphaga sp. P9-11]|uniref:TrlF family AAA-like ATPase n=1 Tax=Tardiphaga sp. P9-11 TaxID=2024614 RepID=UPI001561C594|nr:AAA family ATPase [Tardiphaga sp. P9-11]
MAYQLGLHPGTVWHKSDFQCHTPRDLAWSGSPDLPGGGEAAETARMDWAKSFLKAAEDAGLLAVAISDHHDICLSKYVMAAAAETGSAVRAFPAVEITLADNAQCLAIFDPSLEADTQKLALAAAGNLLPAADADSKTCAIVPARETVMGFVRNIAAEQHLKDVCVILPHFSRQDAHKSLNEAGHHPRFANLTVDGVYIEQPYGDLDEVTIQKIHGKIDDWGRRRRAVVATGDNRSADWNRLGKHYCWIKLGEHSIEALRQALLADEARIVYETPESPAERLVELHVKSTLTGAVPVAVSFNDGFNAIIGGRGAGKSAFLEYLRFGLGRTDRDLGTRNEDANDREVKLIDETLAGDGYVEVVLEREGVRETWRRTVVNPEAIVVSSGGGSTTLTTKTARERFRSRAFRQKGLSSTMNDPSTASEQITSIAAAEEVDKQREIEQLIENARRDVTTALQNLASYWQSRLEHQQAKSKVDDLRQRLTALAQRLEAEGASAEHLKTLEDAPKYSRTADYINQVADQAISGLADLEGLEDSLLQVDLADYEGAAEFEDAVGLRDLTVQTKAAVSTAIAGAKRGLNTLIAGQAAAKEAFALKHTAFKATYDAALVEQGKHKNLIDDSARLTAELQTAEGVLSRARAAETSKSPYVKAYDDAVTNLDELVERRHQILKTAADKVAGKSSDLLKARVKKDRLPAAYVSTLAKLFEGTGTQQVDEGCSEWVGAILTEDQASGWQTLRKSLLEIYEAKINAGSPPEASEGLLSALQSVLFKGARTLTERQRKRIYINLSDASISAIVSAVPRDSIILSYMDDGRAIDFKMASPGQQASALLELLLKQSAGTLIIDQPEDDLDNRVIMRIVELLRKSKTTRQLIFSTHNSNIVVNGDADKVIALKSAEPSSNPNVNSARIQIDCDGAIETPSIRPAITSIMEGGREAFDLRGRKYGFETA